MTLPNHIKQRRLAEAHAARAEAGESWRQLSAECEQHGCTLRRFTDAHYHLVALDKSWLLDLWVGSGRIVQHEWTLGHINLPSRWTLADVVEKVIEKLSNAESH